jgi:hypothetical protein
VTILIEGSLEFDFSAAIKAYKFDDNTHGVDPMRKVDFVVEWDEEIWLLEVKDPEDTALPSQRRASIRRKHRRNLQLKNMSATDINLKNLSIYNEKLLMAYGEKGRDSFLYLYLCAQMQHKPIRLLVLVGMEQLSIRALQTASKWLSYSCALEGPFRRRWTNAYFVDAQVLNLQSWRINFPRVPIRRLPISP